MILLFWALFLLLGCAAALYAHWGLVLPFVTLLLVSKRPLQGSVFFLLGIALTLLKYPSLDVETLEGHGLFQLENMQPSQSPFQRSLAIQGIFKTFRAEGVSYRNIPCTFYQTKAPTSSAWIMEGKLEKKAPFQFVFKPIKHAPWESIPHFSLVNGRHALKANAAKFFKGKAKDPRTRAFYASMATGNIDDRLLAMEFRKLGLGHILAISGFHFALIAAIAGFFFRLLLPHRFADGLLLVFLTLYFLYLGPSPSVLRAYLMISLFVLGLIIGRRSPPLNLLGAALFIELLIDPLSLTKAGFQLSFLATFGLLAFYQSMHAFLEKLLPKRTRSELRQLPLLDLHGYFLCSFFRKSLALNFSVQLITLPAVLYIFGSFPFLSLPYNLILPPLLSISLALLPFTFFPPIQWTNEKFTSWLLSLIANPPELLNFKFFTPHFSLLLLIPLLTGIGFIGLTKREKPA